MRKTYPWAASPTRASAGEAPERTAVSALELFSILDGAFATARAPECHRCFTPPPLRARPAGRAQVNWMLPRPRACPAGCAAVLYAIVTRLERLYLLEDVSPLSSLAHRRATGSG